MMLLNIADDSIISEDIVKLLGPTGINLLLEIMWKGYYSVCKKGIKASYDENRITEELFVEINEVWPEFKSSFKIKMSPINQKPDEFKKYPKGLAPTIDFVFRSYDTSDIYFGAECKLLKDNSNIRRKNYVSDGLVRYLNKRYSNKASESSMIGYIVNDSIEESVTVINSALEEVAASSLLTRSQTFIEPYYLSKHQREDDSDILLHHLFFNFNNAIK